MTARTNDPVAAAAWVTEVIKQHDPKLRKYLRNQTSNREEVPDLAQEVYVRLWMTKQLGAIDNALAYIYTIAQNLLIDRSRRRKLEIVELDADPTKQQLRQLAAHIDVTATPIDAEEAVDEALSQFPANYRKVFLRLAHGASEQEIADELGFTLETVQCYRQRMRARMLEACAPRLRPAGGKRNPKVNRSEK